MNPGLDLQITLLKWLARSVAPYFPPGQPRPVALTFIRKETSTMALVFALKLAPAAPDVVRRTLTVSVNGTAQPSFDATDGMELKFQPTDQIVMSLVDTNAAGIESAPSVPFSATASALVPPATPASPTLTFLREEADPTPVPADPTNPPTENPVP